mgnify:FL=1|jgi:hypothetical protein
MDIIYFISGILTIGVIYAIALLRSVKSKHALLQSRYQSFILTTSSRYDEMIQLVEDTTDQMNSIKDMMGEDKYQSVILLTQRLDTIDMNANKEIIRQLEKYNETQRLLLNQTNDLAMVKRQLIKFEKDPDMLSRY